MLELQSAVMAGYSLENDEQVKSGKGVLKAHLYCVHPMVLALEHQVAEPLQWAPKGESHLCELGAGADRGVLKSTWGLSSRRLCRRPSSPLLLSILPQKGASPLRVSQYMDYGSPSAGPPLLPALGGSWEAHGTTLGSMHIYLFSSRRTLRMRREAQVARRSPPRTCRKSLTKHKWEFWSRPLPIRKRMKRRPPSRLNWTHGILEKKPEE